jgi:hypothetical protein
MPVNRKRLYRGDNDHEGDRSTHHIGNEDLRQLAAKDIEQKDDRAQTGNLKVEIWKDTSTEDGHPSGASLSPFLETLRLNEGMHREHPVSFLRILFPSEQNELLSAI